jgi:Tol biopolymer transport system component/DNA-binding winged helix-turn-helix (wHTH) protein
MAPPTPPSKILRFGPFEVDAEAQQLRRAGAVLRIQPQPFKVLLALVFRAGEIVTREQLRQELWGEETFVDFEHGLNYCVRHIREVLGDNAQTPRYVETVPRRGYRFVAAVLPVSPQGPGVDARKEDRPDTRATVPWYAHRLGVGLALLALAVIGIAAWAAFHMLSPQRVPSVVSSRSVTTTGKADQWARLVSDGSRLYFLEREGDHWNLMQTSISGGPEQRVDAPFHNTVVLDVSPDHANLLIASFTSRDEAMPLWIWPVQGGAPRRVGEVLARNAVWCPNNRQILFEKDDGIYKVDIDGTNVKKFLTTQDADAEDFAWSADGRILRFTLTPHQRLHDAAIWEANADGTNLHRLLPGWEGGEQARGSWSRDGKYFFFRARQAKSADIWVLPERTFPQVQSAEPARLTHGPLDFGSQLLSDDGRRMFVFGGVTGIEFVAYDLHSHQFHPAYTNLRANWLDFSQDGQWIAFSDFGRGTLGTMKTDGSQRLDLTLPNNSGQSPRWSPDGKFLTFLNVTSAGKQRIFLVPARGGAPRELYPDNFQQTDPAWSPDGKLLAFCRLQTPQNSGQASGQAFSQIHILDLSTNTLTPVPSPGGMRGPAWSPNGKFMAAITEDRHQVMLLDVSTRQWTKLSQTTLANEFISWEKDGTALYYQDLLAAGQPVYRLRLSDHRQELVTSFEMLHVNRAGFLTLAPDGQIIAALNRSGTDIYSLDLDLP